MFQAEGTAYTKALQSSVHGVIWLRVVLRTGNVEFTAYTLLGAIVDGMVCVFGGGGGVGYVFALQMLFGTG